MSDKSEILSRHEPEIFERYLGILGLADIKPAWETLADIISAHLIRIPFENVSKIYRAKIKGIRGIPSLEEYLDGIEHFGFGGTCFTNNYYLHLLLIYSGFDVRLCAADISVNGAPPNGHMVNVVRIDGREAIADAGYGAPFRRPLPLGSSSDVIIQFGPERYELKPRDDLGRHRLEVYRDGQLRHGYVLKPAARQIEDFQDVIARSYSDGAPFLNRLVFIRFYDNRSLVLRNYVFTEMTASGSISQRLETRDDIQKTVVDYFGIPADIITDVLDSLGELKDSTV